MTTFRFPWNRQLTRNSLGPLVETEVYVWEEGETEVDVWVGTERPNQARRSARTIGVLAVPRKCVLNEVVRNLLQSRIKAVGNLISFCVPSTEAEGPDIRIPSIGDRIGVELKFCCCLEEMGDIWSGPRIVIASPLQYSVHGIIVTTMVPCDLLHEGTLNQRVLRNRYNLPVLQWVRLSARQRMGR